MALITLDRWIAVRMEILSGVFAASLAAYLVYWDHVTASNTGFSLNMAGTYIESPL